MPQTRPPRLPASRPLWTAEQDRLAYWGRQFSRVLRRLLPVHLEGPSGFDEYLRRRNTLAQHLGLDVSELDAVLVAEKIETLLQGRLASEPPDWREYHNPVDVERFGYHLFRDDPRTVSLLYRSIGDRVVQSLSMEVLSPPLAGIWHHQPAVVHVHLTDVQGSGHADIQWQSHRALAIRWGLEGRLPTYGI